MDGDTEKENGRGFAWSSAQVEIAKWLAVSTMVVDHVAVLWFDRSIEMMTAVGRLSMPLFALVLAYNAACHSRSRLRYLGRLVAFAALSQWPRVYAFDPDSLNIFFTLAAGLGLVILVRGEFGHDRLSRWGIRALGAMPILFVGAFADYGFGGVLQVLFYYLWIRTGRFSWAVAGMAGAWLGNLLTPMGLFATLAVPLALLVATLPWRLPRTPRWFYYAFYPVHMVLLRFVSG